MITRFSSNLYFYSGEWLKTLLYKFFTAWLASKYLFYSNKVAIMQHILAKSYKITPLQIKIYLTCYFLYLCQYLLDLVERLYFRISSLPHLL